MFSYRHITFLYLLINTKNWHVITLSWRCLRPTTFSLICLYSVNLFGKYFIQSSPSSLSNLSNDTLLFHLSDCASDAALCDQYPYSVCDDTTSGKCTCATAQGFVANTDNDKCLYGKLLHPPTHVRDRKSVV